MAIDRSWADRGESSEAEHWFVRLRAADCNAAEREAFERWRADDPEHARAFEEVVLVYERAAELNADPAIMAATQAALRGRARVPTARWAAYISVPALAAGLVLCLRLPLLTPPIADKVYATRVGERQSIILADGSTILLDTATSVTVRLGGGGRVVRLTEGQAQFRVVHNAAMPFVVDVGGSVIRDVGTEFQVRTADEDVTVTVLEGAVAVSASGPDASARSEQLGPGQRLLFDERGTRWITEKINLRAATSWTTGDLTFEDDSLEHIVSEMNRYTLSQIRLGDSQLHKLRVSGVFHAGDQQSFILTLRRGWSVRSVQDPSGDFILYSH